MIPEASANSTPPVRTGRIAPRFAVLLNDPRHLRGDLGLLRTAIRRGWIKDQGDRDDLCQRFSNSMDQGAPVRARVRRWNEATQARVEIKTAWVALDLTRQDQAIRHALWPNGGASSINGRRRSRWRVGDMPTLDASAIRAELAAAVGAGSRMLQVRCVAGPADERQTLTVELRVIRSGRGGIRIGFCCPRCRHTRTGAAGPNARQAA